MTTSMYCLYVGFDYIYVYVLMYIYVSSSMYVCMSVCVYVRACVNENEDNKTTDCNVVSVQKDNPTLLIINTTTICHSLIKNIKYDS